MVKAALSQLPAVLAACNTEEEVKSEFAKAFKYKLDTRMRMDLYTPTVLFEFKFDRNFQAQNTKAPVVAQALYYIREIKYGKLDLSLPAYICIVDKNESFFIETKDCKSIYDSDNEGFDWDRAPSTPCPNIVAAVGKLPKVKSSHVYRFSSPEDFSNFQSVLEKSSHYQPELDFSLFDKKSITEENFESAFRLWSELFGAYVENGRKAAEYFLADLHEGKSQILRETHEVAFDMGNNTLIKKPMPIDKYDHFWSTYDRISNPRVIHSIWQRVDRLSVEDFRRFTGEFYTPVDFAQKGLDYLEKVVGERWWERGYRLWDMAAGTGNLEYTIPEEALPYCFISTLLKEDAEYCARLYPQATVFQYDYLNDDVALLHHTGLDVLKSGVPTKMPMSLFEDLQNPDLKWIIFINPPFATANVGARDTEVSKDSVSMTAVRSLMSDENLLETSRELFTQFLWRISRDFAGKTAHLGMFSKIKYINANNDQKMRENFFKFKFERGFCFPSTTFPGNKGSFPVGFLVWNLKDPALLKNQDIWLDVFNERIEKIGLKQVPSVDRDDALSKWVDRPRTSGILPPLKSAITVADSHKDVRDGVASEFLFSLMAKGNDFANQNFTALLSGPYVSAGAISVTPGNFERAMIWHAVRRIPKATWLNDRDQWMQPTKELTQEFISDSVIWSAFSTSNQTASLTDINYHGKTYDLPNNLFPFEINEIKAWKCTLGSIESSLQNAKTDRFLATWLSTQKLSPEAASVVDWARRLYMYFFANSASVPWPQYKIKRWDVGLYQVRRSLADADLGADLLSNFSESVNALRVKLLPQLSDFGFMQGLERLFEDEIQH
jgi:hypothetical protein